MTNADMQNLNRATMAHLNKHISAGMTLREVRRLCEEYMLAHGADSFWYWDVGAFVFAGDETTLSVSGRQYTTSDRKIADDDIITVDLSPQSGCVWGDYARTIILERGQVVTDIDDIHNSEWRDGLNMELLLHKTLCDIAAPDMTFEELYLRMNGIIARNGFVNLDFAGNLGHSIESSKADRIYIEKGNKAQLGDARLFTFEPHIAAPGSAYGYKREDIYFFDSDRLIRL